MKMFLPTLAVLIVFATPAFAQSFCACDGTGSVLAFANKPAAPSNNKIAVRQSGLDSFAMVPMPGSAFNPDGPATTGGGNRGYNEMLRTY